MTLTEFLPARIAEETPRPSVLLDSELAPGEARGAEVYPYDSYRHAGDCGLLGGWDDGSGCTCDGLARTLAECEAKRRIAEIHKSLEGDPYGEIKDRVVYWCAECDHDRDYNGIPHAEDGCPTLRHLAAIYVDHADYRPEWKP